MKIDVKLEGIKEAIRGLENQQSIIRRAYKSALGKTADQSKTMISRQIRGDYNLQQSKLNTYIVSNTKTVGNKISAVISGKYRGLPLYLYGARQEGVKLKRGTMNEVKYLSMKSGRNRGGKVTVQVLKSGGRKEVLYDPKPFIAQMSSGHMGIFHRVPGTFMESGRSNYKGRREAIIEMFGPGVAGIFGTKKVRAIMVNFIKEKFIEIFKHELDYYLKKK